LLESCNKPVNGPVWENFLLYLNEHPVPDDGLPSGYICHCCLEKFQMDTMPARCIQNGFDFEVVPDEIQDLNKFEKVFTQQVKAFQVVTKMKTVSKRLPPNHRVSKVCGSTFHLPLPIEKTLKRLPMPEGPQAEHSVLFDLLRSLPNKQNVVWQDLV